MKKEDFAHWVGYQIYPKSFKDSNGDGVGDLQGIIQKLPYLKELGVDFVWINPIYKSPQVDGGYDIADFYSIDERFGDLNDLKELLQKAHENDLKVIMDLVINHTSDQHPWFIESKKSKDNPYRDYYHWMDATPDKMPNNWQSFFGGSTWTYDEQTAQAYFHVFAKEQPDLNWKNPQIRQEIYTMIRWWLELGVDGFRLDAISHIQKEDWKFQIKSKKGNDPWQPFMNVAGIEHYMSDLKEIFDEYGALTVGEASGVTSTEAPDWTEEKAGYLKMIFELEHNIRHEDNPGHTWMYAYKKTIIRWQKDMLERGWNALYLENHDQPRAISCFGDGSIASAKALAVSYMLLRGTPFIYQGQEIGMSNFPFTDIAQTDATEIKQAYEKLLAEGFTKKEALSQVMANSRDHSRTPMQWDASENTGFTSGEPWMPIHPDYEEVNTEKSQDILSLYKALIQLRHEEEDIAHGSISFLFEQHLTAFVYERDSFLVITNLGKTKAQLDFSKFETEAYQQVLGSSSRTLETKMSLLPWEYQVFKKK
ncbi:alpha-glucosidase [Lactococcus garvieae]|uniref:Glucan 1,6-alpha-glucosidase n=1 Tax=Lactococcus garvieae DCC43 TaxID=1231377 RepID=K2PWB2_9LACT|nr:alpha-glucosidase [Lactococcus garvieae]EKF51701.1 Alpha-glucosidase [Lactococcus garvieae DCC43]